MKCQLKRLQLLVSTMSFCLAPVCGLGQGVEQDRSLVMEEIVVEARRRSENLQDVPVSVTALTAAMLENNGLADLRSIQDFSPGLNIEEGFDSGSSRMFIRGLGTAVDNNGVEPGVGVYIDDVYVPTGVASNFDLFSLERIEVLRGPQGTLYGRNTFGGAIKMYSREFTNEAEGYLQVATGAYERRDFVAEYSAPLVQDLVWINAGYGHLEHEGIQDLIYLNDNAWGKNTDIFKLRAKVQLSDQLSFTAGYFRSDADAPAKHPKIHKGTDLAGLNGLIVPAEWGLGLSGDAANAWVDAPAIGTDDVDSIESDINSNTVQVSDSFSWNLSYDINPDSSLTYIGSSRAVESLRPYDVDGKVLPHLTLILMDEIDSESHELRLNWESSRFNLVAGAFYYKENQLNNTRNTPNFWAPGTNLTGLHAFLDTDGDGAVSRQEASALVVTDPMGNPTGYALSQSSSPVRFTNDLESLAGFVNVGYEMTERLSVTAGVRYTRDEREASAGDEVTYLGGFTGDFSGDIVRFVNTSAARPTQGGTLLPNPTWPGETFSVLATEDEFSEITPSVTLDYRLGESQLIYASWQRGFQGGQLYPLYSNLRRVLAAARRDGVVDPQEAALIEAQTGATEEQTVDAFEVGFKSTLFDGRLLVNAAAYHYQFDDLIASIKILIPGAGVPEIGRAVPTNAGSAESTGVEVEGQWLLTENISIYGNVAWNNFDVKEVLAPDPGDITRNINIADTFIDAPVLSPEVKALAGARYSAYLFDNIEFRAYANLSYRDEMGINARALGETFGIGLEPKVNATADAYYISPELTKIDLGIAFETDRWLAFLNLRNAGDKRRPVSTRFVSLGFYGVSQSYNPPRTWETGIKYRF